MFNSLKNLLKHSKDARKIFGKKEIEIIIKQLEGFTLSQSEKNRLSRDIRKKLSFIKEINRFSNDFELEKNRDNKRLIERAVATILKDELSSEIGAILLFGSFADKSFTRRSDIDICVVFKGNISLEEVTRFRIRISGKLPEKIDIQVFHALPQKIKREIAKNHKVLYYIPDYDNIDFTIQHLKDNDYFIRMKKVFGVAA